MVIAKSFAFIHKRNLVNEAVPCLVLDDPGFHAAATDGASITIRPDEGVVEVAGREFRAETPAVIARRIQDAGGIVPAVREHGKAAFDLLTAGAGGAAAATRAADSNGA